MGGYVTIDLGRRTATASAWSLGTRLVAVLGQLATTIVLARLLAPGDFGLVAIVVSVIGFVALLNDFGVVAAVVQRRTVHQRFLSTAFWLNAATSVLFCSLTLTAAPLLARVFDRPELTGLTRVAAFVFVLSFGAVHQALLERRLAFRTIALIEATAILSGCFGSVIAAANGAGAVSLLVLTLMMTGLQHVGYVVVARWRPSLRVSGADSRGIVSFSGSLTAAHAVNYWSRNADNLIVGGFLGPSALGFYTRAYALMLAPLSQVTNAIARAAFPALSALQGDLGRVRSAFLRVVGVVALVAFPAVAGLAVVAADVVRVLLGDGWEPVAPVLAVLAIAAIPQVVAATVGVLYQALGRTDVLLRWMTASAIVTVGSFFAGVYWGVLGVAIAYAIRSYALVYHNFAIPGRLVGMPVRAVWQEVRAPFFCASIMAVVVRVVHEVLVEQSPLIRLVVEGAVGAVVYAASVAVIKPPALGHLFDVVRRRDASAPA